MDLLEKPNLSQREREKIKQMSEGLLGEVKSLLKDIDNWREKAQTSAKVKSGIYDYLYENYSSVVENIYN